MKADIKIVYSKKGENPLTKLEAELNDLLEVGYNLHGSPLMVPDTGVLIYTMIRSGTKERIDFKTAYPSEKQRAYICWAYDLFDPEWEDAHVARKEASALIQHHKDESEGMQFTDKSLFETQLGIIRGEIQNLPLEPQTTKNYVPTADDYDDDIPF